MGRSGPLRREVAQGGGLEIAIVRASHAEPSNRKGIDMSEDKPRAQTPEEHDAWAAFNALLLATMSVKIACAQIDSALCLSQRAVNIHSEREQMTMCVASDLPPHVTLTMLSEKSLSEHLPAMKHLYILLRKTCDELQAAALKASEKAIRDGIETVSEHLEAVEELKADSE